MSYTTVLLQKITECEGKGLDSPSPLGLEYTVPQACTAGLQYVRLGTTSKGMVNVTVLRDGKTMRYFPVAAGDAMHVQLAIVDQLQPGEHVEVNAAGEETGTLILDIGILEVSTGG